MGAMRYAFGRRGMRRDAGAGARHWILAAAGGLLLVLGAQGPGWSQSPQLGPGAQGSGPLQRLFTPSDEISQVGPQILVDQGNRVYMFWVDSRQGLGGDIRLRRSTDGGRSWTEPVTLDRERPEGGRFSSPFLIAPGAGRLMLLSQMKIPHVSGRKDMRFLASADDGVTWPGPARVLNREGQGMEGELAADGNGNVYAVWYDERDGSRREQFRSTRGFQIFFNRSEDFGKQWLAEDVRLNGGGGSKGGSISALPRLQIDDQGHVYVAWVDNRSGRTEIHVRVSEDRGKTWGPEINVSRGALSAIHHQLLAVGRGRALLVWTDARHGADDVFFSRTEDGGKQWSEPVRLSRHREGVALSRAPHMAVSRDGRVYVVWQDTRNGREDIYLNVSEDWGRTWLDRDIRLDRDDAGTGVSELPRVVVGPDGRVVVAWSDDRTGWDQILLTQSVDGGKTWLDREIRVDTDTPANERARGVRLAADPSGAIHTVWEVWKGSGSAIEKRVVYSRVELPAATAQGSPPTR